jgi:hypothetical protein
VGGCKGTYSPQVARTFLDKAILSQLDKLSLGKGTEAVGNFRQCPFCDYGMSFDFPDAHETFECRNPVSLRVARADSARTDHSLTEHLSELAEVREGELHVLQEG